MIPKVSLVEAAEALAELNTQPFVTLMKHGTMSVEYYAPDKVDIQTPHMQDELYIIACGKGTFVRDGERIPFSKDDVLFVPAGMEHRFEDFTHNFATWVIFYGPKGGEKD